MIKLDERRLEELTEWVRNKPEEAAQRIMELEISKSVEKAMTGPPPSPFDWKGCEHQCVYCGEHHVGMCRFYMTVS